MPAVPVIAAVATVASTAGSIIQAVHQKKAQKRAQAQAEADARRQEQEARRAQTEAKERAALRAGEDKTKAKIKLGSTDGEGGDITSAVKRKSGKRKTPTLGNALATSSSAVGGL